MHARTSLLRAAITGATLVLIAAAPVGAQAWSYPSFQMPRITPREFNFGLADADGSTSLLFQWREGSGSRNQLSLDLGYADVDGSDGVFFLGGQFGRQMTTSNANMPFDLMLTVGANVSHVDLGAESSNALRVPIGVSAGHVFPLEGGTSITPYIHPRFVIAHCDCGGADDTNLGLEFDLGGEFKFNSAFAVRLSASFGDDEILNGDSFGVSLAWTPGRSSRSRR